MKPQACLILLISLIPVSGSAQDFSQHPEYDTILTVVRDWTETLASSDIVRRAELTVDGSLIQRMVQQEDGSYELLARVRRHAEMQASESVMVERYWHERLLISDQLAVFFASYDFWIDGEFSHCGTDVFELVKLEGSWKIGNMTYTIQRSDCPKSPLGPLPAED